MFDLVRWIHLLAASVWVGGLITLGALVPALRKAGADRPMLQATARQFGRVSWTAMVVALITGVLQLMGLDGATSGTSYAQVLFVKLLLVGLAVALALGHQFTASRTSAAVRGMIQAAIMLLSLGIMAAAVMLGGA